MAIRKKIREVMRRHRLATLLVAIGTLVVLSGLYFFWSAQAWSGYEAKYAKWQKELQSKVDTALKLPANTTNERSAKLAALSSVSSYIESSQASLCGVGWAIDWQQQFITENKQRKEACSKLVERAQTLVAKLRLATQYLESDQALAKIVASVKSPDKMTEKEFEAQAPPWQKAAEAIKKLQVEGSFASVKDATEKAVQSINTAWRHLLKEHKEKNKDEFITAQAELAAAYASLAEAMTQSKQQFDPLADSLQTAYADVFTR